MVEKLHRWLVEISHPAEALQAGTTVPLQQARSMLDALQVPVAQKAEGDTSTSTPVSCIWVLLNKIVWLLNSSLFVVAVVFFFDSAKGKGASASAGQLHPDSGGRSTTAAVS